MKKILSAILLIILTSSIVLACDTKVKTEEGTKELNLSGVVLAYKVTNFAWGEVNYAYIIDGYGNVKRVNLVGKKFNEHELSVYLNECMENEKIQIITNLGEIPKEVIEQIERINTVQLEKKSSLGVMDMGTFNFYCASGEESGELILIQTLGESVFKSKEENIINICAYIDTLIKKIPDK